LISLPAFVAHPTNQIANPQPVSASQTIQYGKFKIPNTLPNRIIPSLAGGTVSKSNRCRISVAILRRADYEEGIFKLFQPLSTWPRLQALKNGFPGNRQSKK
jgi:hypothetical protein